MNNNSTPTFLPKGTSEISVRKLKNLLIPVIQQEITQPAMYLVGLLLGL